MSDEIEIEIENFKVLEYPEGFLVITFDPWSKDYLFFSDALYALLEYLGYEIFYFRSENSEESKKMVKTDLIFRSYLDSSFLRIESEFYFVKFESSNIPLIKIKKCDLISDGLEEDVTKKIKELTGFYPKKIDLLSLLGLDFEENNYSLPSKHTFYPQFYSLNKKFSFKS